MRLLWHFGSLDMAYTCKWRIFQVWHILTSTKNGHMSATFGSCNCTVVRYGVTHLLTLIGMHILTLISTKNGKLWVQVHVCGYYATFGSLDMEWHIFQV